VNDPIIAYWGVERHQIQQLLTIIQPFYRMCFRLCAFAHDLRVRNTFAFDWRTPIPQACVVVSPENADDARQRCAESLAAMLASYFGEPTVPYEELLGPLERPFVDGAAAHDRYLAALGAYPADVREMAWYSYVALLRTACSVLRLDPSDRRASSAGALARLTKLATDGNICIGRDALDRTIYLALRWERDRPSVPPVSQ